MLTDYSLHVGLARSCMSGCNRGALYYDRVHHACFEPLPDSCIKVWAWILSATSLFQVCAIGLSYPVPTELLVGNVLSIFVRDDFAPNSAHARVPFFHTRSRLCM